MFGGSAWYILKDQIEAELKEVRRKQREKEIDDKVAAKTQKIKEEMEKAGINDPDIKKLLIGIADWDNQDYQRPKVRERIKEISNNPKYANVPMVQRRIREITGEPRNE
jgi:hypothetical protein